MATKKTAKKVQAPKAPEPVKEEAPQQEFALSRKNLIDFARLDNEKEELTKKLKDVEKRHKVKQADILRAFEQLGTDSVKFAGHSIYTFKQLWARAKEGCQRADVIAALKKHGFKDYVAENYNVQSLSARMRELELQYLEMHKQLPKEGRKPYRLVDYLPEPLVAVLNLTPDFSVRIHGTIPTDKLDQLEEEVKEHGD